MSTHRAEELERYPKFKQAYIRAFDRMLKDKEDVTTWKTGEDVYQWWINVTGLSSATYFQKINR